MSRYTKHTYFFDLKCAQNIFFSVMIFGDVNILTLSYHQMKQQYETYLKFTVYGKL